MIRAIRNAFRRYVENEVDRIHREEKDCLYTMIEALQDRVNELEENDERLRASIIEVVNDSEQDWASRLFQVERLVSSS